MGKAYDKVTIRKRITIRRFRRKRSIWDELKRYGSDIIHSEEMERAFEQVHHRYSTVGEHTMRVAFSSVRLCRALKKIHVNVDVPAVVVASLSHDLGILGRHEKFSSMKECSREHPKDSVVVARSLVNNMSEKTEDIIERRAPRHNDRDPICRAGCCSPCRRMRLLQSRHQRSYPGRNGGRPLQRRGSGPL